MEEEWIRCDYNPSPGLLDRMRLTTLYKATMHTLCNINFLFNFVSQPLTHMQHERIKIESNPNALYN